MLYISLFLQEYSRRVPRCAGTRLLESELSFGTKEENKYCLLEGTYKEYRQFAWEPIKSILCIDRMDKCHKMDTEVINRKTGVHVG